MNFELNQIKSDFIKVIEYSQQIQNPQVDVLFDKWLDAKRDIIEAMGGKLIYEIDTPVTFELSDEGKNERAQSFISLCWDKGLDDLAMFLEKEKDNFFTNYCKYDHNKDVKKGTKLIKAFKFFIDDKEQLTDMQNKASMIIQENKIEGKLCFSVHPLDYLSISETTYNWRSCHALDGEYRAGNISYMLDSSTIVCYLKGAERVKLPRFPEDVLWNSKKWRVLLYLSNNWKMIFAGKQYPFSTKEGMDMIVEKFFNHDKDSAYKKPASKNYRYTQYRGSSWSKWSDYKLEPVTLNDVFFSMDKHYIPIGDGVISIHDLVKDDEGSRHYNDVLKSTCYTPMYTFLVESTWWGEDQKYTLADVNNTHFHIGGNNMCLRCGQTDIMDHGSGSMLCYTCERDYGTTENSYFSFCERCGVRIETEDGLYIGDGIYCKDCFYEVGEKCEVCRDYYLKDEIIYDEETDEYVCEYCYKHRA